MGDGNFYRNFYKQPNAFLSDKTMVADKTMIKFYKQEAQGPLRLSTALQNITCRCVRECILYALKSIIMKIKYVYVYRPVVFIYILSIIRIYIFSILILLP